MIPFVSLQLDKVYNLRFGMGAIVEFESLTGLKLMEIGEEMSFDICAKILWVMMRQENKELTLEQVCALVDNYADSLDVVIEAVTKAIEGAFNTGKNSKPLKR